MLQSISIRNYAIIDELEISFDSGLNIMTGETGAGKSIILGALSLVLGDRADTKVLFNKETKCTVEAVFAVHSEALKKIIQENDLDYEAQTVLRREINVGGKSRAFINDTPVALQTLKSVGALLVNLHSQHETLSLMEAGFQLDILDIVAGNNKQLHEYRPLFQQYKRHTEELAALIKKQQQVSVENDYLIFQLNELREAQLTAGEQHLLEAEMATLSHAESIKAALEKASGLMDEGDVSVTTLLAEVGTDFKSIQQYNAQLATLNERLQSVLVEIKDIVRETARMNDSISVDPQRLLEVNERLITLHRLCKKHQTTDADALIEVMQQLEEKVDKGANLDKEIDALQVMLLKEDKQLRTLALSLHNSRMKASGNAASTITNLLKKVGMPDASFDIQVKQTDNAQLTSSGFSEVEFLFSANKGIAPQTLKHVASGGELSRLMLSIKSLLAGAVELPTMIFDEIDTGISGEVAKRVGGVMQNLSQKHQLICITHLPQIATAGNTHYYIYKDNTSGVTRTRIRKLNQEERVTEIAKMLSGDNLTDAALANARELIAR